MSNHRSGFWVYALLGLVSCKGASCGQGTKAHPGFCSPENHDLVTVESPSVTTTLDTYSLDVTLTVEPAPGAFVQLDMERRIDDGPWEVHGEPATDAVVLTDSPPRGSEVSYRARTTTAHDDCAGPQLLVSPWSEVSSETIVPLPGVPISWAVDAEPDGDLDNDDLEAAMDVCYGLGGCNLVLAEGTYREVELKVGEFTDYEPTDEGVYEALASGFALVGQGMGLSILEGRVYPADEDAKATVMLDAVPSDGWIFMGFTLQGRKQDQEAPEDGVYLGHNVGLLTAPPPGYDLEGYNTAPFIPNHNGIPGYEKHNLLVHDLEIRDYMGSGISALALINPLVLDNVIENIGCHHACEHHRDPDGTYPCDVPFVGLAEQDPETLCGANLGEAALDGWNTVRQDSIVPGTKANGFGIGFFGGITGGLIANNVVRFATKHGIELFGPQEHCATDGVTVADNDVQNSTTGYANNGGCNATFVGNLAHSNGLPGQDYTANLGRGFICGGRGENNQWLDNTSSFNNSAGYSLGCWGEDDDGDGTLVANITLDGNASLSNCMTVGPGKVAGDLMLANSQRPRGFEVLSHTIDHASQCEAGVVVNQLEEVTISNVSVDSARDPMVPAGSEAFNRVVWLDRATHVTVEVQVQIGDYDIAQGGYYDFNSQLLRDVDVTIEEGTTEGGSILADFTIVSGTATGQNVSHNGVLLP